MKRYFQILPATTALILVGCTFSCIADPHSPMILPDVPLDKCFAERAIVNVDFLARGRELKILHETAPKIHEMVRIVDKYGGQGKKAIKDFISAEDAKRFDALSAQTLSLSIYQLAESRIQRDMDVLDRLLKLAEQARDNTLDRKIMDSIADADKQGKMTPDIEDAKYFVYLLLLRNFLANEVEKTPKIQNVCNLNLALAKESDRGFNLIKSQILSSPQLTEIMALSAKYGIPEGKGGNTAFDGVALTPAETERLHLNQNVMAPLLERAKDYSQDMADLQYFAEISRIEYEWNRDDMLQLGGNVNIAAMDKLDHARYINLSKSMQRTINLWNKIDNEIPSQATINSKNILEIIKKYPVKK